MGYSWIDNRYFLGFSNPFTDPPFVWVGDGGGFQAACHPGGTPVQRNTHMAENEWIAVFVAHRLFFITCKKDEGKSYKSVVVDIYGF